MRRLTQYRGVGTTALRGGGNSQSKADQTFFRPGQWVVQQEWDILRPQVLQMCQGFRLQSALLTVLKAAIRKDQQYLKIMAALGIKEGATDPNFTIEKDLLLYKNRWYIPEDEGLRKQIMEAEDDSRLRAEERRVGNECGARRWRSHREV